MGNQVKPVAVNPLKASPALGAAYALQGIQGALPVFHAAPGCTFLGRVLLTQHTREPVGLMGTDILEATTVMGGWEELADKVEEAYQRLKPKLIGVVGTALSEVRGEDVEAALKAVRPRLPVPVVYIPAPDYVGGFAQGFAKASLCVAQALAKPGPVHPRRVNLIPGSHLTPAEVEELAELVRRFNLEPLVFPDLSTAVDGSKPSFSNLSMGGTPLNMVEKLGSAVATLVVGRSAAPLGKWIESQFGVPLHLLPECTGVEACDDLVIPLINLSCQEPDPWLLRQRARLTDAMMDTHQLLYGRRVALGLEVDHAVSVGRFLLEMGMEVEAVVPVLPGQPKDYPFPIRQGDLEDLEELAAHCQLMMTNSHGAEVAKRLSIPLIRAGFPIFDRLGETLRVRVGYRGSYGLLFEIAGLLMAHQPSPQAATGHTAHSR